MLFKRAHEHNPTYLWLAEEFIKLSMSNSLANLLHEHGDDAANDEGLVSGIYDVPAEVAAYLYQIDQKDPGILMIQGLIEGERLQFVREKVRYEIAPILTQQPHILDWYEGYSLAMRVHVEVDLDRVPEQVLPTWHYGYFDCRADSKFSPDDVKPWINRSRDLLSNALVVSPWSAWIRYTLGCLIIMWRKNGSDDLVDGQELVEQACKDLNDIRDELEDEPYLARVRGEQWFKDLLPIKKAQTNATDGEPDPGSAS